ncbi:hypothetical protein HAZT_HAZT006408 [Hyalella azteca]|uniref:Protein kinase domain-containing protein n=1 Tax=Hyalella azteca TaxID=294128 RepID=A0A6A0H094_HYAAZ|nr:hypothetical protein HAZT_HAZT006408 [Hyalella azteca]
MRELLPMGCWSAGGRAARSPGVTTPHFVTSNKLGEKFQSPKPAHPPDYDSLIAKVSGDFGIKSAIVRAAKQDPEYKGVETLVVPLYIPKGAVPIRLARIPRSGGDNAKPQPSDPIGAFNRRTRLSSITSKRQGGPRRGSHPTPPPSYLRGWGRRILPKADARIGLQGDSEVSESQTLDLPELIRSKKNQNSRIVHFVKTTAADDLSSSTESTLRTSRPSTTTEVVQILQLRRDIVLAGFSDVMRASSSVSKDRFREITSNLDKLNKQLAEQGILIIHAEVEGDEEIEDKVNHKQVMLIEELLFDEVKTENTAGSTSVYTEDSGGTSEGAAGSSSVYLVGMVGIFPLALVAAYVVRRFLRGDAHKKALPESEERPDGFTPPTHHVPRSHSMLPPLPELKLTSPLSSSTLTLPMGSDVASSHGLPNTQPSPTPWEFNRSQLKMVSILGEGNFGVVWKAEARGFCDYAAGGVLVAVKRVKEGAGAKEKQDLLRELSVMQLLGPHPNVVSLLGCCTQNGSFT